MKTRMFHIFVIVVLLSVSACASGTYESRSEESKPQKCLDIKDCPGGYRCDTTKTHTCVRAL